MNTLFNKLYLSVINLSWNAAGYIISKQRYGGAFSKYLEIFHKGENMSDFIKSKACEIVKTHPYYKRFAIKEFNDIPIIDKNIIVKNYNKFINNKKKYKYLYTSGTSGQALKYPITKEFLRWKFASSTFFRESHGLLRSHVNANFFGRKIFTINRHKPPYWLFIKPTKQLLFSQYHLNRDSALLYLKALEKYNVKWFHGYPSFIISFINYLYQNGIYRCETPIKAITVSSETIRSDQKQKIEEFFSCKVYNYYSQVESVAEIYQNNNDRYYVNNTFSYVELIPFKINENLYKIVGTQIFNEAMPLIRYDTGDVVRIDVDKNEIIEIIGRQDDVIVLPDGRTLGRLDKIFSTLNNILEAQIVQNKSGELNILIVKNDSFTKYDLASLKRSINKYLQDSLPVKIIFVDSIPREKSGKLKFVKRIQ